MFGALVNTRDDLAMPSLSPFFTSPEPFDSFGEVHNLHGEKSQDMK